MAVALPEVLGDHFAELIVNLGKIAESGKSLQIMKPSPFLKMQQLVELDEGQSEARPESPSSER